MAEIATDNFNRADGALGANWTVGRGNHPPTISSNQVIPSDTSDNIMHWTANDFAIDHYSQATMATAQNFSGIVCRSTSTDYITGQSNSTADLQIIWYNAGAYTAIGTTYTTAGWSNGDVMKLEADMYFFRLYQNATLRVSGSNTSVPLTGDPGINVVTIGAAIDDWSGGNIYPIGIIARAISGDDANVASNTVAVTIPAGYENKYLLVLTQTRDATDADRDITSVVWNSHESFTKLQETNNDTYDLTAEIWGLTNPTAGTFNVVVTFAGTVSVSSVIVLALDNVEQSGQPDATGTDTNVGNPTADVTTVAAGAIVFDSIYNKHTEMTMDASQILIAYYDVNGTSDQMGCSREYKATGGAVSMDWTGSAAEQYVQSAVSIKPYTGTATIRIDRTAILVGTAAASNVATYSGVDIGEVETGRITVVTVGTELLNSVPTGCTIDYGTGDTAMSAGTAATIGNQNSHIYYLATPSGVSATIKVTYGATNPDATQNRIAVYKVMGATYSSAGSDTSTDIDVTDPVTTGSITLAATDVFVGIVSCQNDTNAKTWANATEDIDVDAGAYRFTTATRVSAGTVTITLTGVTDTEDGAFSWLIFGTASGSAIKTIQGLAKASVKEMQGLAIASMKTLQGLA